jgi:3-oxoacyl-[acyl-carrier protein] reductase
MKKTYIVIGGSGGIGKALCKELLQQGNPVIAGVRNTQLIESDQRIENVDYRSVDAEDWESIDRLLAEALSEGVTLGGVALCVGSILLKPAHLTRIEEFDTVLSKNLYSAFGLIRAAGKRLAKTGGSVVLVSSAAAGHGLANHEAISAAKAGVEGLVRSAAATYAPKGMRINCVAPGLVETGLSRSIVSNPTSLKFSQKMHALGRIGKPEEVAKAIAWLLDEDQSWITGQSIGVDGGLAKVVPVG